MQPEETDKDNQANSAQQPPEFLVVGRIARPHGVRGALVVDPLSKFITDITSGLDIFIGSEKERWHVRRFSPHRKRYLLTLENIQSRDEAETQRNKLIYLRFEDTEPLPDGDYYDWQLLGLKVITDQDEELGTLKEIIETGANDVYVVRTGSDKEILLPAIDSVIMKVDLEQRRMVVHLIPGLIP